MRQFQRGTPYCPPQPVDTRVLAGALSPSEKNQLWAYIKGHRPDQVAFFNDPIVRQLLATPGATPVFERELVVAALGYVPGDPCFTGVGGIFAAQDARTDAVC